MIFAKVNDAEKYFGVINGLDKATEFIKNALESGADEGRYELSDGIYAVVSTYETKAPEECSLESHRIYADVQAVISGSEAMLVRDKNGLQTAVAYSDERDIEFYESARSSSLVLEAGSFVLLLPEDAHAPGIMLDTPEAVKKVVVKIRL